jgi:hypothetical protein
MKHDLKLAPRRKMFFAQTHRVRISWVDFVIFEIFHGPFAKAEKEFVVQNYFFAASHFEVYENVKCTFSLLIFANVDQVN